MIVLDCVLKIWIEKIKSQHDNGKENFYRLLWFQKVEFCSKNSNFWKWNNNIKLQKELCEREPGWRFTARCRGFGITLYWERPCSTKYYSPLGTRLLYELLLSTGRTPALRVINRHWEYFCPRGYFCSASYYFPLGIFLLGDLLLLYYFPVGILVLYELYSCSTSYYSPLGIVLLYEFLHPLGIPLLYGLLLSIGNTSALRVITFHLEYPCSTGYYPPSLTQR